MERRMVFGKLFGAMLAPIVPASEPRRVSMIDPETGLPLRAVGAREPDEMDLALGEGGVIVHGELVLD